MLSQILLIEHNIAILNSSVDFEFADNIFALSPNAGGKQVELFQIHLIPSALLLVTPLPLRGQTRLGKHVIIVFLIINISPQLVLLRDLLVHFELISHHPDLLLSLECPILHRLHVVSHLTLVLQLLIHQVLVVG